MQVRRSTAGYMHLSMISEMSQTDVKIMPLTDAQRLSTGP